MCESLVVPVGAEVVIKSAEVLLLNGETFTTANPLELAEGLIDAFENPRPNEIPQDPIFIRIGYQCVVFTCQFANTVEATLTFRQHHHDSWASAGGPAVEGKREYNWQLEHIQCPRFHVPGKNGKVLGESMKLLSQGAVLISVHELFCSAGVGSYDDWVAFLLHPAEGFIGKGVISLRKDDSNGDFQRMLFDWEGGNRPGGRGDHVGNYERAH